jgi:RecB family exonuclease
MRATTRDNASMSRAGAETIAVLWSIRDWARAIAALPAEGSLPCRSVLVPRERVAHALRRELVREGLAAALAGTRFLTPLATALELLQAAGLALTAGEEQRRPARLAALFHSELGLAHFPPALLRERPGWGEAFARALRDLEGALLRPEDLDAAGDARLGDVAAVWRAVEGAAGASWTAARIFAEAAGRLGREPACWPHPGPVLAVADGHETAARAAFIRAIPGLRLALWGARPLRERHLQRVLVLHGPAAAEALRAAVAPRGAGSERELLAAYLFEPPAVLADPARPRSRGADGTVDLEEHAGLEEELEASADWVARQVLEGTPLEEVGVLLPALDPLAGMLCDRLARLPWPGGELPVHVAGGLPLASRAAGARLLALVRALRAHLAGDAVAELLPALRTTPPGERHLSLGAATDLLWSLGTAGGAPGRPEGALDWAPRAAARESALARQLEAARQAEDAAEGAGPARRPHELERLLGDLRAVRPALEALVELARLVLAGAPLAELWPALRAFAADWLLQPGGGPPAHALVAGPLDALATDEIAGRTAGDEALALVEAAIAATRVAEGRYGEPAVYVGSVAGAQGLSFRALRVIGLAEGHLPALPREDPVVPDALRAALEEARGTAVPGTAERALADLHALEAAVRNATGRVALSFARRGVDQSEREPGSVLLEAAAALGRAPAAGGRAPAIPDLVALRRDGFRPARAARLAFRTRHPLGEAAWQDAIARAPGPIPAHWRGDGALDLSRLAALLEPGPGGPLDGLLGDTAGLPVPGLGPERPISPSRLERLLECPYRFLLQDLLGLDEPAAAPPRREIGQPAYGGLVHRVAEAFYRIHGTAFCAREGRLADWIERAEPLVEREFQAFLAEYPLVGESVQRQQRERLRTDLRDLLEYDWREGAGRRFVAVERSFGGAAPVELAVAGGTLFVRGRIDRIDVDRGRTLVRDLKTGRPHRRLGAEADPHPVRDTQIAVYGLVARALAPAWGLPEAIAVAYAYVGRGASERSFRDDFDEVLAPAARQWLGAAAALLRDRLFPRTPDPADCSFCAFRPVCGDEVYARARGLLEGGGAAALARFARLKGLGDPEAAG